MRRFALAILALDRTISFDDKLLPIIVLPLTPFGL
jgi:hypothetical protein